MNLSYSECSSGCESGWTMYFDEYSDSSQVEEQTLRSKGTYINEDGMEEKEDLSMVSDASSGPPHLHEDDSCYARNQYISYISDQTEGKQKKPKGGKREDENSHLDDTASSPVGDFSKEKSTFNKNFGFLKTSVKGKGPSEKSGVHQGKK